MDDERKADADILNLPACELNGAVADAKLLPSVRAFRDQVVRLQQTRDTDKEAYRLCGRELCKLSRAIRFFLGRPEMAPEAMVQEIICLFRRAASEMHLADDDEEFRAYRNNVDARATMLDDRLSVSSRFF